MRRNSEATLSLVQTGLLVALTAICAQLALPLPSGVPLTMQTFAVALFGFLMGGKRGAIGIGVYLLLGSVGIPVFSHFKAGVGVLFGLTGGFLWGFLPLAFFCGMSVGFQKANGKGRRLKTIFLCAAGLLLCHAAGVLQFSVLSGNTLWQAFLIGSLPYLPKDAAMTALAYMLSRIIRKSIGVNKNA